MASTPGTAPRARVYAPWSATAWRDTTFVASGVPLQAAGWLIAGSLWMVWTPRTPLPVLILAASSIVLVLLVLRPLTSWQRERCWAMLGLHIPRMPGFDDERPHYAPRYTPRDLRSPELWRVMQYHMVAGPFLALGGLGVVVMWASGLALTGSGLYGWALPSSSPVNPVAHPVRVVVLTLAGG
ncbi:MAG: sensor histidine kinase, partial [Spirillospora sp.]